jgi:hypothetical protein
MSDTMMVGFSIIGRQLLQRAQRQVAVTDFATAGTRFGFTSPVEKPGKCSA